MPDTNHLFHFHLADIGNQHLHTSPFLKHAGAVDYAFGNYGKIFVESGGVIISASAVNCLTRFGTVAPFS